MTREHFERYAGAILAVGLIAVAVLILAGNEALRRRYHLGGVLDVLMFAMLLSSSRVRPLLRTSVFQLGVRIRQDAAAADKSGAASVSALQMAALLVALMAIGFQAIT
jgi:hypothetical protein